MSEHRAIIRWRYSGADFAKGKYSREHTWEFDGGITIAASSSPSVISVPYSNRENVDPEEAFVAAVSSCHMMSYLYVASRAGFVIQSYIDEAVGVLTKNERGSRWISKVWLRPRIEYSGTKLPTSEDERRLHREAHEECYIANSIKTEVVVESP